jgi:transposase
MSEPMPDFESLSHAELVQLCQAFWQQLQTLTKRVERLEAENQALKANGAKIRKTSLNSSIPPSKDQKHNQKIIEEPRSEPTSKRRHSHTNGGRPLHPNPDQHTRLRPDICQNCGAFLLDALERVEAVYDKIELPTIKPITTRVTRIACQCKTCQQVTRAPEIPGLEHNSIFGSSVQTLVTHARFSQAIGLHRLSLFCKEVLNLEISQGGIVNILKSVNECLKPRITEITDVIRQSSVVKSDETTFRVQGKNFWEWVFVSKNACLHILRDSRSKSAIGVVFPESALEVRRPLVWVSDLYPGQGQSVAERWQVCLSHQIRDCQYAIDAGDVVFAPEIQKLFREAIVLHKRRAELTDSTWYSYRLRVKRELREVLLLNPTTREGRNLKRRYLNVQDSLLTFLEFPDVPATNNESEQRIRWSVIFRKVTNGSRSVWAAELFVAYRSVVNTGAKLGLSALESLRRAVTLGAFFAVGLDSS